MMDENFGGMMVTVRANSMSNAWAKAGSSGKGGSPEAKGKNSPSESSGSSWGSCYQCGKPYDQWVRCSDKDKPGGARKGNGQAFSGTSNTSRESSCALEGAETSDTRSPALVCAVA